MLIKKQLLPFKLYKKYLSIPKLEPDVEIKLNAAPIKFPCIEQGEARQERLLNQINDKDAMKRLNGLTLLSDAESISLDLGGSVDFQLAYETWGELNAQKNNAILLHTGLSSGSHAKSNDLNTSKGWWEAFIGPDKALDTNKYFIICTNVLGGCFGSTGPASVNPITGNPFATTFPLLTLWDMVRAQFKLLDQLGIKILHASVGSSLGGMTSLASCILYPERIKKLVSISACAQAHPYAISLRYLQRQAIMSDTNWKKGHYYNDVIPHQGLKLARQIATIHYRSGGELEKRFGRGRRTESELSFCADYEVERYLEHAGNKWCETFDANSLLYISKAIDMFDVSKGEGDDEDRFVEGLKPVAKIPSLILGVKSDLLFPVALQHQMALGLKKAGNENVVYYEIDGGFGHDSFLVLEGEVGGAIKGHLELG